MKGKRVLVSLLLGLTLWMPACAYIVLPEDLATPQAGAGATTGWSAQVTGVSKSESGDLHIDLSIRNDTGDWSAMQAAPGKPAVLTSDGTSTDCDRVQVSSGGHRLAPGFIMRGFTGGTNSQPDIQRLYVECKGAEAAPGAQLSIDYSYVTGQYNYYDQEASKADGRMKVELDGAAAEASYPVGQVVEGLIQKSDVQIVAINKLVLSLAGVERTETGLRFTWKATNPSAYPSYVHIGIPPVIGSDGILYGLYETPDMASVPLTPAGGEAEWSTEVAVPPEVSGLYIMLSVESGKARLFSNYAIDITDR